MTKTVEALRERVYDIVSDLDLSECISLHNGYCNTGRCDTYIYDIDDFDIVCECMKPWEIARATRYGSFEPINDWFYFNVYGNLCGFTYFFENCCPIDIDVLVDYIIDNEDCLYNDEIKEILDEWEEEEEEDEEE